MAGGQAVCVLEAASGVRCPSVGKVGVDVSHECNSEGAAAGGAGDADKGHGLDEGRDPCPVLGAVAGDVAVVANGVADGTNLVGARRSGLASTSSRLGCVPHVRQYAMASLVQSGGELHVGCSAYAAAQTCRCVPHHHATSPRFAVAIPQALLVAARVCLDAWL